MKCKDCAKYDWQTGWCQSVHDSPDEERERDCDFYYPGSKALSARIETLEKLVAEYQDELIPGYRERVEKVWRGEWKIITTHNGCTPDQDCVCSRCGASGIPNKAFCDSCGAPMTDEAVQMVMARLEALHEIPPTT